MTLFLTDGSYNGSLGTFNISTSTQIIFYDFTGQLQCNVNCISKSNHYFNNTLGWIMGYRLPYYNVDISGNIAPCILDLNGTKYLILAIDDYNQNHVNNGLVSITEYSNVLKMPSYYSPDLPYTCLPADPNTSEYSKTQIMLPSAPRTLTNSQLYTINEINKNRNNTTNYLSKAPTTSDILGILPIKTAGLTTGSLIVEFSGTIQGITRTYFGPVDIDRMCVKLLDDKGNILNLNGNDWCVTIICECLYQY